MIRLAMIFRGRIKNGVVVQDSPVTPPVGTPDRVEAEQPESVFQTGKTVEDMVRELGIQSLENLTELDIPWPKEIDIDEC